MHLVESFIADINKILKKEPKLALFMVNGAPRYELNFNVLQKDSRVLMHEIVYVDTQVYVELRTTKKHKPRFIKMIRQLIKSNVDEIHVLYGDATSDNYKK